MPKKVKGARRKRKTALRGEFVGGLFLEGE